MAKNIDSKKKYRGFMYEQQLKHLPNGVTPDDMYARIEQKLKPKRLAMIVHDKDVKDDGSTPAEDHVHIMMEFDNARYVNAVAKQIGDKSEYVQIWRDRIENGYSYLIHATTTSKHKHKYSPDGVKANFDYRTYIKNVSQKVKKAEEKSSDNRINSMLDLIATGDMTVMEAKSQLTGSQYAKTSDKIKKAHELFLERSAEKLRQEMVANEEMVLVHWFYGESETGKTCLAETLAAEAGPYYKTTTVRDPFQFYQAEQIIILDELRPEIIPYSELLAILDPFSRGKVAVSSRYFNKTLSCRTIYITTPYDPITFCQFYHLNAIDRGEQLFRRLSSVLRFDMDFIHDMKYEKYSYVEVDKKENHYSRKKQKQYELQSVFDRI